MKTTISLLVFFFLSTVTVMGAEKQLTDRDWIPGKEYKNGNGEPCCGHEDCMLVNAFIMSETDDTYTVHISGYDGFMQNQQFNLTTPIQKKLVINRPQSGQGTLCKRNVATPVTSTNIRCLFVPPSTW